LIGDELHVKKQFAMYVGFAAYAVVIYASAVELMFSPIPFVGLIPLMVSFVGAALLRWEMERLYVDVMFHPKAQSWAFLFGDSIALTVAMAMIWFARSEVVPGGFWAEGSWFLISAHIGLLAGICFRLADRGRYHRFGAEQLLVSPTKVWHDFVTYSVIAGVMVWAGFPLLLPEYWVWETGVAVVAILAWGVLGVRDIRRNLNPFYLHPRWDARKFSVI
jgi:hypothetical protein